jgi:hypothetical protein
MLASTGKGHQILSPNFRSRLALATALTLALISQSCLLTAQSVDATEVLKRATEYVAKYEATELGNLLVVEEYLQNAMTYPGPKAVFQVAKKEQRRTQADFLILLVGEERLGLRRVTRLDGVPVQSKQPDFATIMDNSPEGIVKQLAAIREESSAYNIGLVQRNINVPTFALKVARQKETSRFSFSKKGNERVSGIETWEIRFEERRGPTLIHADAGQSLLSSGSLWIEPATGRIVKTDLQVENPYSKLKVKGRITVTYSENKKLGILVPTEMRERYETEDVLVTCVANYSNFRMFNVEVSSKIDTPAEK